MFKFNTKVSLSANVKCGLLNNQLTMDDMSKEIGIKIEAIRTSTSRKFIRGKSSSPQDRSMINYLKINCQGFKEYWEAEKLLEK